MSYDEYMELFETLVKEERTTGKNQSTDLVTFTKLNLSRMKRWNKTVKISDEAREVIQAYDREVTWLVITEAWCGDAAHIVPVMHLVSELNTNIQLRLVLRDDHDDLMSQFLTDGGKSIPKLIALDQDLEVLNTFGPRPKVATQLVQDYKALHGTLTAEFKTDLQMWYNKDKGQSTVLDLTELLTCAEVSD